MGTLGAATHLVLVPLQPVSLRRVVGTWNSRPQAFANCIIQICLQSTMLGSKAPAFKLPQALRPTLPLQSLKPRNSNCLQAPSALARPAGNGLSRRLPGPGIRAAAFQGEEPSLRVVGFRVHSSWCRWFWGAMNEGLRLYGLLYANLQGVCRHLVLGLEKLRFS